MAYGFIPMLCSGFRILQASSHHIHLKKGQQQQKNKRYVGEKSSKTHKCTV